MPKVEKIRFSRSSSQGFDNAEYHGLYCWDELPVPISKNRETEIKRLPNLIFFDRPSFITLEERNEFKNHTGDLALPKDEGVKVAGSISSDEMEDEIDYDLYVVSADKPTTIVGVSCFQLSVGLTPKRGGRDHLGISISHEGLYITPESRGNGFGLALAAKTADICVFQITHLAELLGRRKVEIDIYYCADYISDEGESMSNFICEQLQMEIDFLKDSLEGRNIKINKLSIEAGW